jgi:hypothetical protein
VSTFSGYAKIGLSENKDENNTIPVTTLDEHFQKLELSGVDLIKVDIEGSELDFFMGATKVISKYLPIIFYEDLGNINGSLIHTEKIVKLLNNLNYSLFLPTWFRVENDEPMMSAFAPHRRAYSKSQRIGLIPILDHSELIRRNVFGPVNLVALPNDKIESILAELTN